jgi:glycerol-3-phosphate responsive antiterminator
MIFLIHEHFVHCFGIHKLLESYSSKIFLSENILKGLNNTRINLSYYHHEEYKYGISNFKRFHFITGYFFLIEFELSVLLTPEHALAFSVYL